MLQLHRLRSRPGARKTAKRVGRGLNCGGSHCGRGNSGQNSRSGPGPVRGFEGGQTPLWRRFPHLPASVVALQNSKRPAVLRLDNLQRLFDIGRLTSTFVSPDALSKAGITGMHHGLVIVGQGHEFFVQKGISIIASLFDQQCISHIERLGGSVLAVSCALNGWRKLTRPQTFRSLRDFALLPPTSWEERVHYSNLDNRGYLNLQAQAMASSELICYVRDNFVLCPPAIPIDFDSALIRAQKKINVEA